ncbi:MAG: hypothetical protein AAB893_03060 [Patescibacteria group bacterium]
MVNLFLADATDPLGLRDIQPPVGSSNVNDPNSGLVMFINRGFTLLFMGFGLYVLVNFIRAAFWFIGAQGDPKNIEKAKSTLTQSAIGLILILLVFVVGGVIGQVFFGNWNFLLDPIKSLEQQGVLQQ